MAAANGKVEKRTPNDSVVQAAAEDLGQSMEVLTLSEAATYLRVPDEDILRLANLQELPGRMIGNEWRFLKAGLQHWLRTPRPASAKEAFLAIAGVWKDDPDIEEIVREAHRRRGRAVAAAAR